MTCAKTSRHQFFRKYRFNSYITINFKLLKFNLPIVKEAFRMAIRPLKFDIIASFLRASVVIAV